MNYLYSYVSAQYHIISNTSKFINNYKCQNTSYAGNSQHPKKVGIIDKAIMASKYEIA